MKAQGSLEYLIIIAAVLAVAAIVVFFLTSVFGSNKASSSSAVCKDAASRCATELSTSAAPECSYCDNACNVNLNWIMACKKGNPIGISN